MIVWIDLETTGLNPRMCSIIEVACVVTSNDFHEVASYEALIRPTRNTFVETGAKEMHKKSGLWQLAKSAPKGGIGRVDKELSDLIKEHTTEPSVLAGSSVHFDRGFIECWLPKTNALLHYRNLDMSSIKQFVHFALDIPLDSLPGRKSESKHRAMDDIRASLAAADWYADFLVPYTSPSQEYYLDAGRTFFLNGHALV